MFFLEKFNICNLNITACDYEWVIDKILNQKKLKIIYAPIASHPIALANINKKYYKALKQVNYLLPDSQYVRWSLMFLYGVFLHDRVYGPELFTRLLKAAERKKLKIFLIGNRLSTLINKLKKQYPQLLISGLNDLNFGKIKRKLINQINNKINKAKPALIFIGIGSPAQHYLAVRLKEKIPIMCVGAAFDFISGNKSQAPKWIQKYGIEWFYSLIKEPRRLLFRYLLYNNLFIILVLFQKLNLFKNEKFFKN